MPPDEDTQVVPALDTAEAAVSETAQQEPEQTQAQAEEASEVEASSGDEQPNALQEAAKEPAKPAKNPIKPFQARIDELTRNWREEQRQRTALEAELEAVRRGAPQQQEEAQQAQPQPGHVPADMVDRLAEQRAVQITNERQFNNDCNLTFVKGKAAHPDFEEALSTFGSLGGLQRDVVEDALGTDAPETVLYMLGKEPEEAMRILALPRNKRIAEFTKMTLKAPAKPNVSKAPAPIKPVGGTAKKDFDYADDSADDSEWQAKRNAERRAAGKI